MRFQKKFSRKEIKYFKEFTKLYGDRLIFLGDFNLSNTHSVFTPLYRLNFSDAFTNQKTSLKQKCTNEDCLANAYDHIFYQNQQFKLIKSEPILFFEKFKELKLARKLSDHIPILATFQIIN